LFRACFEARGSPTPDAVRSLLEALSSTLEFIRCSTERGPTWALAVCPNNVIVKVFIRSPSTTDIMRELGPYLHFYMCFEALNPEALHAAASKATRRLGQLGIPVELVE
jgi:hypothetical protein